MSTASRVSESVRQKAPLTLKLEVTYETHSFRVRGTPLIVRKYYEKYDGSMK